MVLVFIDLPAWVVVCQSQPMSSPGTVEPTGPTAVSSGAPPEQSSEHPAEKWPEWFGVLEHIEVWVICFLASVVFHLSVFLIFWIVSGCGSAIHDRLVQTIKGMNTGWKMSLLVLIPLFFRPIFKFLFYLRKGPLGTESKLPAIGTPPTGEYKGGDKPK